MAISTKRIFKKSMSWAGLFFFVVAAYMLYVQLSKYSWADIEAALFSIPKHNLLMAGLASLGGYVALSSYDYLALRYIHRRLNPLKWIFAGFIGFSVSNNAGHAIVSVEVFSYVVFIDAVILCQTLTDDILMSSSELRIFLVAVLINFECFALELNFSHACPPWTFALFGPCGPSQTAEAYGVRLSPH